MNLIDQIIDSLNQWHEHLRTNSQPSDLAALEQASLAFGQRVAQLALSYLLQQAGTGYLGSSIACCCSSKQRFERLASKPIRTLVGEVTYTRAYYRCRECRESSYPLDEKLGQSRREISAGVERAISLLAARLSFPETEKVLKEMTGVEITSRQIETIAEQVGAEAERRQKQQDQLSSSQPLAVGVGPKGESVRKFVVEMDGVQVGLQDGRWQEVKCGIVYELGQRVEVSEGRCELIESQRCALRGEVKDFRKRVWSMCVKAGIREEDKIIVIGDGAEWIEQTAQHLFPGSVRILDYYHASERISEVAAARWGEGSKKAKEWREQKQKELKEGEVEKVIGSMRRLKMRGEGEETRRGAIRYLVKRKEEMKYGEWRKEGLPIGSGAIESSCKQIVSARCKQAGMRWSEEGVDAILALRCLVINGRIDELCPKPEISIEWKKAA